ncbi:PfkB family carbohydrate kinase [Microbacterium resistens]
MRGTAVIGEALVDVVGGEEHPGGSPMNVAVGLARLGEPVVLHTLLGPDARGDRIRDHLDRAGVVLGPESSGDGATWTATATLDDEGRASYRFALDGVIPVPALDGLRLAHAGSIGALRAQEAGAVRAAFQGADAATLRSLDPNIRADVMGEQVRERMLALARACHVVKLSDEDALALFPGATVREAADRIAEAGARLVVVTRGGEGCAALADGVWSERRAAPVTVVDTIGAGDAFMSGLLFALLRDGTDRLLVDGSALPAAAVESALATASASASIAVSRAGANPPAAAELDAALGASLGDATETG